jgi:hypothetical protein
LAAAKADDGDDEGLEALSIRENIVELHECPVAGVNCNGAHFATGAIAEFSIAQLAGSAPVVALQQNRRRLRIIPPRRILSALLACTLPAAFCGVELVSAFTSQTLDRLPEPWRRLCWQIAVHSGMDDMDDMDDMDGQEPV